MTGHVAFDLGPLRPGAAGVGRYVASLFAAMGDRAPTRELVGIGLRRDVANPAPVLAARARASMPYPIWLELGAAVQAKRSGATLVHYTDGIAPLMRVGRTVVTIQDLSIVRWRQAHRLARYPRIPLTLAAARLADRVLVPSQATADEVVRLARVPASSITVTPLAAGAAFAPVGSSIADPVVRQHGLEPEGYVLCLGTVEPRKNHLRLVEAFERLVAARAMPDGMQLAIAGSLGWGYQPVLDRIGGSPAHGRIRMLGFVPDQDLAALLSRAALVSYVSLYEGFGLPVLEALACGAPVVTSNASSMPEVAGDAAVLVDPNDVDEIASGVRDLLAADAATRARMRAAGLRRAALFSWAHTATLTDAVYEGLG